MLKRTYIFIAAALAFMALTACKPGVYYPFGVSQPEEQTKTTAVNSHTNSPPLEEHPVVTTDIIPS